MLQPNTNEKKPQTNDLAGASQVSTGVSGNLFKAANQTANYAPRTTTVQQTAYQQNMAKPVQNNKWYAGDQPTSREMLGKIYDIYQQDKEYGQKLLNNFHLEQQNPGSHFYSAYSTATNSAVKNLASYGIDARGINDDWYAANPEWQSYLIFNGTTNTPSKPGKKATAQQKAAYEIYQLGKADADTKNMKTEWQAMQEELSYWALRDDLNMSDDEIIDRVEKEMQKKYPTLYRMEKSLEPGGALLELNEASDFSRDNMYGVIWAARNNGGAGSTEANTMLSAIGKGTTWTDNPQTRAKLDWNNAETYSPYEVSMTLNDAGLYFGVRFFNDDILNQIRQNIDENDETARKYYEQAVAANSKTNKIEEEAKSLNEQVEKWINGGRSREKVLQKLDALLEESDYSMLKALETSIETGGDLIDTTRPIAYRKKDLVEQINRFYDDKDQRTTAGSIAEGDQAQGKTSEEVKAEAAQIAGWEDSEQMTEEEMRSAYDSQHGQGAFDRDVQGTQNAGVRAARAMDEQARDAADAFEGDATPAEQATMAGYSGSHDKAQAKLKAQAKILKTDPAMQSELYQKQMDSVNRGYIEETLNVYQTIDNFENAQYELQAAQENLAALKEQLGDKVYYGQEHRPSFEMEIGGNRYSITLSDDLSDVMAIDNIGGGNSVPVYSSVGLYDSEEEWDEDTRVWQTVQNSPELEDFRAKYVEDEAKIEAANAEGVTEDEQRMLDAIRENEIRIEDAERYIAENQEKFDEASASYTAAKERRLIHLQNLENAGADTTSVAVADTVMQALSGFTNYESTRWESYNPTYNYTKKIEEGADRNEVLAEAKAEHQEIIEQIKDVEWLEQYVADHGIRLPGDVKNNMERRKAKLERDLKDAEYFEIQWNSDFVKTAEAAKKQEQENFALYNAAHRTNDPYQVPGSLYEELGTYADYMTDQEKNTWYYLKAKDEVNGTNKAEEYARFMADETYGVLITRASEAMGEFAKEATSNAFLTANAAAVLLSPYNAVTSTAYNIRRLFTGEELNPNSRFLAASTFRNKTREQSAQEILKAFGDKNEDGTYSQNAKTKIAQMGYEILTNRLDSAVNAAAFSWMFGGVGNEMLREFLSAAPMGESAATEAAARAKERGASDAQAMGIAVATFFAETVTEAVSLENIQAARGLGEAAQEGVWKDFLKNWLTKAGLSEAIGESVNDIVENITDEQIMGVLSEHNAAVEQYRKEGMSAGDAELKARMDEIGGVLRTAVMSYLSPGLDAFQVARGQMNYYGGIASELRQNNQDSSIRAVRKEAQRRQSEAAKPKNAAVNTQTQEKQTAKPAEQPAALTGEEQRKEQIAQKKAEEAKTFTADFEILETAQGGDLSAQNASVAAVLDIGNTQSETDEASAAAVNLNELIADGKTSAEETQDLLIGATAAGIETGEVKTALKIAALGGEESNARQVMRSDEYRTANPEQKAVMLTEAAKQDLQNTNLSNTMEQNVREYRIAKAEGDLLAQGAADQVFDAEAKVDNAVRETRKAESVLKTQQDVVRASSQAVTQASVEIDQFPGNAAMVENFNKAITELQNQSKVQQEYDMSLKNAMEREKTTRESYSKVKDRVLADIRRQAQARIEQEDQQRAQEAEQRKVVEEQQKAEQAKQEQAKEEQSNADFADREAFVERYEEQNPGLTEEDKERLREQYDKAVEQRNQETPVQPARDEAGELTATAILNRGKTLKQISKKFNIDVAIEDTTHGGTVERQNGYYDPANNRIVIDAKSTLDDAMYFVLCHELTHVAEQSQTYNDLANALLQLTYGADADYQSVLDSIRNGRRDSRLAADVLARKELYDNRLAKMHEQDNRIDGSPISAEQALQEVVADAMGRLVYSNDEATRQELINRLANEKPNVARRILDSIKGFIRKAKGVDGAWKTQAQKTVDMLEKALKDAQKKKQHGEKKYALLDKNGSTIEMSSQELQQKKIEVSNKEPSFVVNEQDYAGFLDGNFITNGQKYFESIGGKAVNPILGEVTLDKYGLKHIVSRGEVTFPKVMTLPAVKHVIENGEIVHINNDHNKKDHAILADKVALPDGNYYVGVLVSQNNGGTKGQENKYSFHSALIIKEDAVHSPSAKGRIADEAAPVTSQDSVPVYRILQEIANYNAESGKKGILRNAYYEDAVKNGDTQRAQELVDEAAEQAGYTLKVYHGTPNSGRFNVFDASKLSNSKLASQIGQGFYFTNSKSGAEEYTKNHDVYGRVSSGKNPYMFEGYLKLQNPIDITSDSHNLTLDEIKNIIADGNNQWFFNSGIAHDYANETVDGKKHTRDEIANMSKEEKIDFAAKALYEQGDKYALQHMVDFYSYDGQGQLLDAMKNHTDYDGVRWDMGNGVKQYAVFDSSQFKDSAPVTYDDNGNVIPLSERFNAENPDIRYSLPENEAQPIVKDDDGEDILSELPGGTVVVDTNNIKYSLNSFTKDEQDRVRAALLAKKDENGNQEFTEEQVDKYMSDALGIASIIASDRERLDFLANPVQKFLKSNNDYYYTLDASTLCAKRLLYQGTFDYVQHALPDEVFTPEDLIDLVNIMNEMGYETPCGICYVESRRRWLDTYAQQFIDTLPEGERPTLDQLTTSDGLEKLRTEDPDMYKAFVDAMNSKGSANPKVVQLRTEYNGDIGRLTEKEIQKVKDIGGLRIQSFSDFETPHLLDMVQAVLDMSSVGLTSQAYTKVPNFAWVFGDTGIKINLSLIGKGTGLDADGNLVFDNVEGMNFDEAMKLRERYSKNVGTILVGINDEHIIAAMGDNRIDFIIPFHKSGWSQEELRKMPTLNNYLDYTASQNERLIVGKKENKVKLVKNLGKKALSNWIAREGEAHSGYEIIEQPDGKYTVSYKNGYKTESFQKHQERTGEKLSNFEPVGAHKYWEFDKSGEWNSRKYLQMCAEAGRIPKFSQFLVDNGDGSFSLPEGDDKHSTAIRTGYWKTLIDFKMYDNDGNGAEQTAVTPNINMNQAQRVLNEHKLGRQMPDRDGKKGAFIPMKSNNDVPVAIPPAERYIELIKQKRAGNKPTGPNDTLEATPPTIEVTSKKSAFHQGDVAEGTPNGATAAMASGAETTLGNEETSEVEAYPVQNEMAVDAETGETVTQSRRYSLPVTDKEELKFLNDQEEKGDVIKTYRTMKILDGKLVSPKASLINGKVEGETQLGQWEKATEHPELIKFDEDGTPYFELSEKKGKTPIKARYNPYMHSSNLMLNDQFKGAYLYSGDDPKLGKFVTVECLVPKSEAESGYHAQYAKDPVGWTNWKAGGVAQKVEKQGGEKRNVFLSRWIKPVRIVPDSEVAQHYKSLLDGTDISVPANVVTPGLLNELEKAGVKIGPPESQTAKKFEQVTGKKYSLPSDAPYLAAVERGEMDKAQEMVDQKAKENGYDVEYAVWRGDFEPYNELEPGVNGGNLGTGLYFTPNKSYAEKFAGRNSPVRKFYLKTGNTFDYDAFTQQFNDYAMDWIENSDMYAGNIADIDEYTWSMIWDDFISENGYDSVKATGVGGLSQGASEIAVQNSWQAKLADPVTYYDDGVTPIPLSERFNSNEPDIRYSLPSDDILQKQIRDYIANGGILSNQNEKTAPAPRFNQPESRIGERQFADRAQNSDELFQQAKDRVWADREYRTDSNAAELNRALDWIQGNRNEKSDPDGYNTSLQRLLNNQSNNRTKNGQARMVAMMALAAAKGDVSGQVALADAYLKQGTALGQALQARKLFKLMTPEGRIASLQKMISDQQAELDKRGVKADLKLSDWIYQAAAYATEEGEFQKVQQAAAQELGKQIPANWKDRLRSWRMLSMLANPRTHIRNIIGNAMFIPAVSLKNKLGAIAELGVKKGEKTKTLSPFVSKAIREFARQDAASIKDVLTGEAKYNEANEVAKSQNKLGQFLDTLGDVNSRFLEGEDWFFLKGHYRRALSGWMQANGYTVDQVKSDPSLLEKGRAYAIEEAQKATYRDFNNTAQVLNQVSRKGGVPGFLVDAVLPFKKTPANILRRGLEYSPVGIVKSLTSDMYHLKQYMDYQNGKLNALPEKALSPTQVIDHLCSGLSGTAITALGFLLAGTGAVSVGLDDDEDKLEKLKGNQEYAVKLNLLGQDVTFTVDWAAPMSMPFFVGAAIREQLEKEGRDFDVNEVVNAIGSISEPVFNLSMLDGINTLFKTSQYDDTNTITQILAKIGTNYATSYVPSFMGAVARTADDTRRKSFVTSGENTGLEGTVRYAWEQVENKIPGVSQTNIPVRDVFGRAETSGLVERILENFILPGYVSSYKDDPVVNELGRVYDDTGDASLIPKDAEKSITYKKQKYALSPEQYDEYVMARGQAAYDGLAELMQTDEYKNGSPELQAQLIKNVWSYATQVGKKAVIPDFQMDNTGGDPVKKAVVDGSETYYKDEAVKAMEAGDWDAYDTCIAALENLGVSESTIKTKISNVYRDQYKDAYRKGDYVKMAEIEDILDNTGFTFKVSDWEKQVDKEDLD